jgi:hydrogenase nickel incorporation protein HypA/HybF
MHELAIAQRLIETASAALPSATAGDITAVKVQLGALAGLSKEELAFGFTLVSTGTPFAGASLEIEELPAVIYCLQCDGNYVVADLPAVTCPACNTANVRVIQGKELILRSIEVSDGAADA